MSCNNTPYFLPRIYNGENNKENCRKNVSATIECNGKKTK